LQQQACAGQAWETGRHSSAAVGHTPLRGT
jgi:hypothetical protein